MDNCRRLAFWAFQPFPSPGYIDEGECRRLMQVATDIGDPGTAKIVAEYEKFLQQVDTDKNGKIELSEFKAYFKKHVSPEDVKELAAQLRLMIQEAQEREDAPTVEGAA